MVYDIIPTVALALGETTINASIFDVSCESISPDILGIPMPANMSATASSDPSELPSGVYYLNMTNQLELFTESPGTFHGFVSTYNTSVLTYASISFPLDQWSAHPVPQLSIHAMSYPFDCFVHIACHRQFGSYGD